MNTMVEIEMNNISRSVNGLTIAVHNRAIDLAIDKLQEKESQIEKLLDNGQIIYQMSLGDRFSRLYDKRHDLYMKKWEIWNTIKMLHNLKMKY